MLLFEIWLAKMQARNIGFSTLLSCSLVGFCRFGGFVVVGLGGFGWFLLSFFPPQREKFKESSFLMTEQVCVS